MKLFLNTIAVVVLVFFVLYCARIVHVMVNENNPISCSADKIMIVAKNGYFCVENAVQIQ